MVRRYKTLGKNKRWSQTNLLAAIQAVNQQGSSKNRAAIEYGVPRQTLNRYLKFPEQDVCEMLKPINTVFSRQQEEELMQYLLEMDKRLYGLTLRELRSVAYQLAEKNHIPHQFNRKTQLAGYDWACGFRKRHPQLALRSPEPTSMARAQGFNKVAVSGFFDVLERIFDATTFPASRVYNVDETGILTVCVIKITFLCNIIIFLCYRSQRKHLKFYLSEESAKSDVFHQQREVSYQQLAYACLQRGTSSHRCLYFPELD